MSPSRSEIVNIIMREAAEAAVMVDRKAADNPRAGGVFWSTGALDDGRYAQVCIYLGPQTMPFKQEIVEHPDGSRSGLLVQHLPYTTMQGTLSDEQLALEWPVGGIEPGGLGRVRSEDGS